jgi:eukaryotic-like serine/threonine-protein kinase
MIGTTVSHYRVLSRLGAGGMGVVYEAEDMRLRRRVALKFLPDEMADRSALQRFRREAEAASALNHPHICTIYDIGEHEGRPFIVMERLEGESLRERIGGKPLPVDTVLKLGSEIAEALAAAHAAGIVHRDIKPANLFVTSRGDAKLLDFGLARIDAPQPASANSGSATAEMPEEITKGGTTLGTIAYMSPEQARGEPLDGRSDLFSLGAVLYEMATGIAPFRGATPAAIFDAILNRDPEPSSRLNPGIPLALEQVILAALEKNRTLRIQSATELRAQLLRLRRDSSPVVSSATGNRASIRSGLPRRGLGAGITGALTVPLVLVGLWFMQRDHGAAVPAAAKAVAQQTASVKRIAVLPFESLGAPEDQFFAEGMADEVRGKISGVPGIAVIGRASSTSYRGTEKTPQQIASELGVHYLLTATVRWQRTPEASRIRLSPELLEVSGEGAPVTMWRQAYDSELSDVFAVQARIATQVAEALQVALDVKERRRLEKPPTSNLAAYEAYLRGQDVESSGWGPVVMRQALTHYEEAVALDPRFGPAWAGIAGVLARIYEAGATGGDAARIRDAAERSTALAPELPASHAALGLYYWTIARDEVKGLEVHRRALELFPDDASLLSQHGMMLHDLGHYEEALVNLHRAAVLDPRSWSIQARLSAGYMILRRPHEALREAERGLAVNPTADYLIFEKAWAHLMLGDLASAHAAIATIPEQAAPRAIGAGLWLYPANSWILTDSQRDLLVRLPPGPFNDDRGRWGDAISSEYSLRGDSAQAKNFAREARRAYLEAISRAPDDALTYASLARVLSLLDDRDEAARVIARATELSLGNPDAYRRRGQGLLELGWTLEAIAVANVRMGNHDAAVAALERLMTVPHATTHAWLRIDPNFAPLRGNARFEKLLRSG